MLDVLVRQNVVVGRFDKLFGSVHEENIACISAFLQDHDAGGDRCAEEQIGWELDHSVHIILLDQIFPDFLFCTTPVHDSWKTDNGCRSIGGQF